MNALTDVLTAFSTDSIPILDAAIPFNKYTPLDLSTDNLDLKEVNIVDPSECQRYINSVLNKNNALVAYGGYLEKRNLYADKVGFSGESTRNIHLGIDFWAAALTEVLAPIDGVVHSFQNNARVGDYGPTIILSHKVGDTVFYSLYGHLSLDSLDGLFVSKAFKRGETLARLGTPDINVNYAPHLHFQLIGDLQGKKGDYPGVCSHEELPFYAKNCPNANKLLKIGL